MSRGASAASLLATLATVAALLFTASTARADDPDITATVDTQKLGVGEVLRLSLHAMSRQHQPTQPTPGSTTGFTVVGSSSGPTTQVTITNGRMVSQHGIDASWSLRADRVGTWTLGPISVLVGGSTYRTGTIRVTVVPQGQGPARHAPDPFDPFGGSPFGTNPFDPFHGLLDQMNGQTTPDTAGVDPKLALDAPLGPIAFLHATVDTTNVVVGQQVTVNMYLYGDASARDPGMVDVHEATAADFVKRTLFEDDNGDRTVARAIVGGHLYNVRLLRKWALFPLRTGDLVMTPMELTLQRNRATGDPSRKSELITVHVTEPPSKDRPPGYLLGDVGKFSLSAETTPREIEEDGAVGVSLTLSGTGNLPAMITPPAQAGLEWLPPEVHEKVGAMKDDHFGGSRTFAYVLRIHKAGDVRLGWIRLPFWDPAARRYDVARVDLGTVTVKPSTEPKAKADTPPDPFSALPDVRTVMGGTKVDRTLLAEAHPALFWLALTVTPFSFVLFAGVSRAVRVVRERAELRAASPETDLKARLALAGKAASGSDARALSSATARALEAAAAVYAEVPLRDARGDEARERLVEAGVADDLAASIANVLVECEAARFSPDAPEIGAARARWAAADVAIKALRRGA
jgi:hypothetical protein